MLPAVSIMDRRQFIELLSAVGVLAGANRFLPPFLVRKLDMPDLVPDLSEHLTPNDLAVFGRERTFRLGLDYRLGDELVYPRLERPDGFRLLQFVMQPGGSLEWFANSEQEMFYGPVKIVLPPGVNGWVMGTDRFGREVYADRNGVTPLSGTFRPAFR